MAVTLLSSMLGELGRVMGTGDSDQKSSWLPGSMLLAASPAANKPSSCGQKVVLVATPVGPRLPQKLQAYHTSVLLGDTELSFGATGISLVRGPQSHADLPRKEETETRDMGYVRSVDIPSLRRKLVPHFERCSYDLLRKNCNSFSDICLFTLLGLRLESRYNCLEAVGHATEKRLGLIQKLTRGEYRPNPKADEFVVEEVVAELDGVAKGHSPKLLVYVHAVERTVVQL